MKTRRDIDGKRTGGHGVEKIKQAGLVFLFLFFSWGCATITLQDKIKEKEEVAREWKDITLRGRYTGKVKINNDTYKKFEFSGFHNDPQRILVLFKPLNGGEVILSEHQQYLLEGELPIVMEMGFGVESHFKRVSYRRVNFAGEDLEVKEKQEPNVKPNINLNAVPNVSLTPDSDTRKNTLNSLLVNNIKLRITRFYRPSNSGNKWLLMTTRVMQPLLGSRSRTNYFLSTPEKRYNINPYAMHYSERSWTGNKLMRTAYLISIPVDVVTTPFIMIGIWGAAIYSTIAH